MTWVTAFHLLLLVHDYTSGWIRRTLAQKIPHRAIELLAIGKPVIQCFFAGVLTVATTNENRFHWYHLLPQDFFPKKNPSRARVLRMVVTISSEKGCNPPLPQNHATQAAQTTNTKTSMTSTRVFHYNSLRISFQRSII